MIPCYFTFQFSRKLLEFDQRFSEVVGGGTHTRDKQNGSSSCTNNKWGRDDPSQQYYVTHGLPTSAVSPAVFVPANIVSVQTFTMVHYQLVFVPNSMDINSNFLCHYNLFPFFVPTRIIPFMILLITIPTSDVDVVKVGDV